MAATDDCEAAAALAEFHASRGSVRDLVQSGVASVPPLFLVPSSSSTTASVSPPPTDFHIPTIDLSLPRSATVRLVGAAARLYGFFHVTNHGVHAGDAVSAVRAFHELPAAVRSAFYSITPVEGISYSTIQYMPGNRAAGAGAGPLVPWRDTFRFFLQGPPTPELGRFPAVSRDPLLEYLRSMTELGKRMTGLLSEALGVGPDRLEAAMKVEGWVLAGHYYPPCPEPALVEGTMEHTDPCLFTVLAQDDVGGLHVRLDDGELAEVPPVPGALLVNVGDVLKIVSNDEFKSVQHGVRVNSTQDARVSVAVFFNSAKRGHNHLVGPLRELVTAGTPARYRRFTMTEFVNSRREVASSGKSSIELFRVEHE